MTKDSLKKHFSSYYYAIKGLKRSFSSWSNLWIEGTIALVVILLGLFFKVSSQEWVALLLTISLVLALELMNTAVESILDFLRKEHHEDIAVAKDIAAGAVLLAAFFAALVGFIIFGPRLIGLIGLN